MSTADLYDAVARVGQALSSGTRLKMLELLAQGERPVVELAGVAGLNVTTASAHLQGLRNAGLVTSRRDGRRILYRLSGPDVAALVAQLCAVAEAHRPDVRAELEAALPTDGIRLMDRAELLAASGAGRVVVVDVRPGDEYAAGHLPGASPSRSTSCLPDSPRSPPTSKSSPTAAAATACCPIEPSGSSPNTATTPASPPTGSSNGGPTA